MIPLTVTREEMALARSWATDAIAQTMATVTRKLDVTIGTMIETPRAAIRADEIAEEADFFSFGTNDLTQLTFGFSRDDVEGRMMSTYLELGLLKRNPFETIDKGGVGELVRVGVERGRATRPGIKLGVCGEHGGDPESIDLFYRGGPRLRVLLAVPGAHRPAGRGPGRDRPPPRRSGAVLPAEEDVDEESLSEASAVAAAV